MRIALTGATGFIGRYIVDHLLDQSHTLKCWYRETSDRQGLLDRPGIEWILGNLSDPSSADSLVDGCDAVVHAALDRPGDGFRGAEGDLVQFAQANVIGSLRLLQVARQAGARRFVFVSTCAVHEVILEDRPLDECHPLWPTSHYGASKAAVEKFIHSVGLGEGYAACALRPTGVYGLTHPPSASKWYDLIRDVAQGHDVVCQSGGKEVHAGDVARGVGVLLEAEGVAGQAYNCYDRYISQWDVATIAKGLTDSPSNIEGEPRQPKHQIRTEKLRALGMEFGADERLRAYVQQVLETL